jgi:hypothetical protein
MTAPKSSAPSPLRPPEICVDLLRRLALAENGAETILPDEQDCLIAHDLALRSADNRLLITEAGRAYLGRASIAACSGIDPHAGQHLSLTTRTIVGPQGRVSVRTNDAESPLVWLSRRKGKDGRPLVSPHELLAGERLRADFTQAQLMPRTTSNWDLALSREGRPSGSSLSLTDTVIAARQRVRQALDAVGPEFSGLLLDVCCFLKGLEDVERERTWPRGSVRVVLRLGLARLARHYGYDERAIGKTSAPIRRWQEANANDAM